MATIKDLTRMCKETKCKDCPLSGGDVNDCWVYTLPDSYPDEDIDAIVDKWVSEHPYDCRVEENIMTELKPCPFCGEKPDDYIRTIPGTSQTKIVMYIICHKCEIEKSVDIQSGVPFERLIEAHEKLIKDWNTRVGE